MESESQMGPTRYRISLILALVLALFMIGAGIWGVAASTEPLLGWFMLVAGVGVTGVTVFQFRRS